ncbi:MAG: NAD(P)H-hydrate dehydratase [Negativicutes bacterium]|nr:NAD(P)H-hydrate dehydratase [Negativicutes bacterium]
MKVATAAEMREIDRKAIFECGMPGAALMESAGGEVAWKVGELLGGAAGKRVVIFAGRGNNGGDGFVVARRLANQGAKIKLFLLGTKEAVAGDARIYLDVLLNTGTEIMELTSERDWDKVKIAIAFADCLVDALVGTGFHGEADGELAELITIINSAEKLVVAMDVPSGIDADTGQVRGVAIKASHTVTFALAKPGLLFQPGAHHAGVVAVADIGIPASVLASSDIRQNMITAGMVRQVLPVRQPWAHKGSCGRVLVVAGSQGFTGAAALAANAAVRAGAGLVTLGVAASLQPIMAGKLTEVMTRPLPETAWGALGLDAAPYIQKLVETCDVLAMGPGLGRDEEAAEVVRETVRSACCPLVLDADALNALVGNTEILLESEALAVLTPHPGELARLTGLGVDIINADRLTAARDAAGEWGCIVVLKGPGTVVAFPDGEVFINTTGNAGMATGGTGDVLTGVITALIAQGLSSHDAAVAGVYIHGLAGDIAARQGIVGMSAGDLLQAIPAAIHSLQSGGGDLFTDAAKP